MCFKRITPILVLTMLSPLRLIWGKEPEDLIKLPDPNLKGTVSVEAALKTRHSMREFSADSLSLAEVGQLLWAAQGEKGRAGTRTAPSAGALYPLEVYLFAGKVIGLEPGIYHYSPQYHGLTLIKSADQRSALCRAALEQESVRDAPVSIVITGVISRTARKYGERAERYVYIEAGCAAQNVYLQATALNLGTVYVGAFYDDQVRKVLSLSDAEVPIAVMPVGKVK